MMKNKGFIIINVFGLGVAIAIAIVSYLAYQYDATFDAVHINSESIYRISSVRDFENTQTRFGYAPFPLGEIVDKTFNDVDRSSLYLSSSSNFKLQDDLFGANIHYVEPGFFQMFTFDFITGRKENLNKSSVFISETLAVRLFRTPQEALDKTLTQVYGSELKEVKITGVFRDQPMNSSFHNRDGSAFMHLDDYKDEFRFVLPDDWNTSATLFVQITDPGRVHSVHKQLQVFISNNNRVREDFHIAELTLDSFKTLAHSDRDSNVQANTWVAPPVSAIIASVIMSALILLIACFNLTNTAIAISSGRLKEIGIRKVMGGLRIQLVLQFIGETTMICFLALVLGIALSDFLIEGWNLMTNNNIHLESNYLQTPGFFPFLICVLLFTGVLAGGYPAFYISRFKPVSILKGKLKLGGTNYFTRTLLAFQFAISLMAIISALAFLQNARYQRDYDLGFNVRGSLIASVNDQNEFDTYRNALQSNPRINSIAGAKSGIFSNRLHEPVKYHAAQAEVDIIEVGDDYLKTMDLKIIEGRDFIKDSGTDQKESIIVTERMAALFKWDNALGKEIIWKDSVKLFVVGVVKNVYTYGLWREMEPMIIRYARPDQYTQIVVNTQPENVAEVNTLMMTEWKKLFPNRMYNGQILGSQVDQVTSLSTSITYGYAFLGLIALILSATGLYSLLSLNIIKRMKEIGIRKIVGASVLNITRVVNAEFIVILIFASLLGSVAAYNWCNIIMSSIWKYHQAVNAWSFVVGIGILFAVSFFTIAHKIFRIATMNPIDSLRNE